MNKWTVLGIKFVGIVTTGALTGIGAILCCDARGDLWQFGSGWLGGVLLAGAVAASLIWKPTTI